MGRLHHTHIIAQRACLKMIYVSLKDAKTSVKNKHNVTSFVQQPPIQCKVQHTSPFALAATKKPRLVPDAFVHCTQNVRYQTANIAVQPDKRTSRR